MLSDAQSASRHIGVELGREVWFIMERIVEYLKNPLNIVMFLQDRCNFAVLPDKVYLKICYKLLMGKKLDLNNPKTFNEKLQWLKIYDRKPEYTRMVDKYEVKKYVAEKIGEEYIIPTLGIWDRFDEIDFDSLPEQFVLKCTHDSGGLVIVRDKAKMDKAAVKKKLEKSLKRNYFYEGREWPYKNVKPRIIAETLIASSDGHLADYKFSCFHGRADNVMACLDRHTGDTKFYFFDKEWNLLKLNRRGLAAPEGFTIPKPDGMDKMFQIAEVLSKNLKYSRIDLYNTDGKIYFGEITFFPHSGFDAQLLETTDILFGNMIHLEG